MRLHLTVLLFSLVAFGLVGTADVMAKGKKGFKKNEGGTSISIGEFQLKNDDRRPSNPNHPGLHLGQQKQPPGLALGHQKKRGYKEEQGLHINKDGLHIGGNGLSIGVKTD